MYLFVSTPYCYSVQLFGFLPVPIVVVGMQEQKDFQDTKPEASLCDMVVG